MFLSLANLLERGGILASADSPRAVDGAHGAASIAISSTMGHTLGSRIWIDPSSIASGNGRHGNMAAGGRRRSRLGIHGATSVLLAGSAGRNGEGILTVVAAERLERLRSRAVVEIGQAWRGFGDGLRLLSEALLLAQRLVFLAALGAKFAGFRATQQIAQARATWLLTVVGDGRWVVHWLSSG